MNASIPDYDGYEPVSQPAIDWRRHLLVLWERRWIFLTVFVVAVISTLFWLYKQVPIYRATAKILCEAETMKILNIQDVATTDTRDFQYINTQVKMLQSRPLAEQAAQSLNLKANPDFLPGASTNADYAGALAECLTVEKDRDSRLIRISADHPNPKVAALLANGVAQEFIRQNLHSKLAKSMEALNWLRQQADELKPKVQASETALQDYRDKNHTVSLEDRQNIVSDKLKALNTALTQAHTSRIDAESEWNKVKALLDAGKKPSEIPSAAADRQVSALRKQLNDKQVALAVLRERYGDQHPMIINAVTELREIQVKLEKACTEAVENIKATYLMAKTKEDSLQQALRDQEDQALDLDRKLAAYLPLKRNAEADRQLYDSILTRIKETTLTGKLETNNIRLVDPALPPVSPAKPNRTRTIMMGIALGLFAGGALSFLVHRYDDKIKSYEDVEALGLPQLASVPHIKPEPHDEASRIVTKDPHSMASEAFRNLRASIWLNPSAKTAKTLMVTSTVPGEGKSLAATNLAIIFAQNNERTLLVDADLRHPVQHKVFGTTSECGLSKFLTDSMSLDEVIQKTEIPHLDIITVGHRPSNPPELLGSSRMRELLENVRQRYDRIVFDCPPVNAVSDPLILLPHVEGVIFILRFNKLRSVIVARTLKKLRDSGVPVVGGVMNNIDLKHGGYYYYYYHYPYSKYYSKYYQQSKQEQAEENRRPSKATGSKS